MKTPRNAARPPQPCSPDADAGGGKTQRGIQSVEVGARLLRVLADARVPLAPSDLAAGAEIASSQAHAYLVSLTRLGLIKRDALSGRYEAGPLALRLGLLHLAQEPALREAVPRAAALAHAHNCSIALCIAGPQGPTIVRYEHASLPLHVNLHVGTVMSLPDTSTGRVFCAFLDEAALRAMWGNQTAQPVWRGTAEPAAANAAAASKAASKQNRAAPERDAAFPGDFPADFAATLDAIRTRGFELGIDAPSPGVSSVCVPVLDPQRALRLTLTAVGASGSLDVRPAGALVRALREAAREIAVAAFAAAPASPVSDSN
ncbi:IclR family transcriptional regulator [Paraburkholderia pallida]|uniref:IclR family transcriptional regulator n=1 Tax=Paraburkholderia pallida TaxID=2547399 RepID=A0A4P7D1R1_9BURK|nr:helix-turn-helix domain-containing protein [Paraburkholderia pallida]QBR00364.1 IclR family transcriptional regulator [Paraburkholderia pallida]